MKTRSFVIGVLVVATISGLAVLTFRRPSAQDAIPQAKLQTKANTLTKVILPRQPTTAPAADTTIAENPSSQTPNQPSGNPPNQALNPPKEPLKDPIAREALTLVGIDPDAEAYWFEAINDMSLPPNERQDLIEDLNEEGLPDPKHPTIDDLPIIFSRLELIEAIGPDAADKTNGDAFNEAYNDLLNLAQLAMGGGKPVN